jgi:hypothetical protein
LTFLPKSNGILLYLNNKCFACPRSRGFGGNNMLGIQGISNAAIHQIAYSCDSYIAADSNRVTDWKSTQSGAAENYASGGNGGASRSAQTIVYNGVQQIVKITDSLSAQFNIVG